MNSKNDNNRFLNAMERILSKNEGRIVKLNGLESSAACKPGDNFMSEIKKIAAFSKSANQSKYVSVRTYVYVTT